MSIEKNGPNSKSLSLRDEKLIRAYVGKLLFPVIGVVVAAIAALSILLGISINRHIDTSATEAKNEMQDKVLNMILEIQKQYSNFEDKMWGAYQKEYDKLSKKVHDLDMDFARIGYEIEQADKKLSDFNKILDQALERANESHKK